MLSFSKDLIAFLDEKFNLDTALSKKPKGYMAFDYFVEPTTEPYYVVQELNENGAKEDFISPNSCTIDLQINFYGVKSKIANIINEPQLYSAKITEKANGFMQEFKYSTNKILSMTFISKSPTLPYKDGSKAYVTALRYRIELKLPYITA